MHNSSFEEAKAAHDALVSALAEFKASGEPSEAILGAFGLAITFTTNGDGFVGRLSHADGAWIETGLFHADGVQGAVEVGRMMLLGIDFAARAVPFPNAPQSTTGAGDCFAIAKEIGRQLGSSAAARTRLGL